jgi:hypothetical protein
MGEVVKQLITSVESTALFRNLHKKSQPRSPHIRLHSVSVYRKSEFLGLPELSTRIKNQVPTPLRCRKQHMLDLIIGPSYEDVYSIGRVLLTDRSEHQVLFLVNLSKI